MKIEETVDAVTKIYDKISAVEGKDKTLELMERWGLDNPHILKTKSMEDWDRIVDKLLMARRVIRESRAIKRTVFENGVRK